mmetsp:Transcript_2225/g.7812  ORF Transcript_2225/g.7812 Transcript_2225/m.7812 type:complete len:233 (-) Transcript_2225:273-971(-)
MYASESSLPLMRMGGAVWMTRSTFMSSPRAATSVATSTGKLPLRNAANVFSRWLWGTSPWSSRHPTRSVATSSLQPFFVSQNTTARPPAGAYTATTSATVRDSAGRGQGSAMCRTLSEALCVLSSSSTRSTVSRSGLMYLRITLDTQGGSVAEKSAVWPGQAPLPMVPKILSTSSWNPMSSMRSASSSTRCCVDVRSSAPRSMRSMTRPGVPTRMCTPRRRELMWAVMGVPP